MPVSIRSVLRRVARNLIRTPAPAKRTPSRPCLEVLEPRENPTGSYSGVVFQDFDSDGVRDTNEQVTNAGGGSIAAAFDRGLGNVVVTAYNSAGTAVGSTTTSATNGAYSVTPSGVGPYRIEFTSLPTGFQAGPQGADSRTTVQFVADNGAANVSVGLVLPQDHAQANPLILNTIFSYGDAATENPNETAIYAVPYSAGGNTAATATRAIAVPNSRVGAVYGVAYDPFARDVYASAYFKRHVGFGPSGTGAVYRFNYPAGAAANYNPPAGSLLYADLNTIFGANTAGANLHDTVDGNSNGLFDDYDSDNGNVGWDAVGKTGLGGMAASEDGQFVFVMNLADRQLYRLPTSGALNTTTIQRVSIPLTNPLSSVITAARFHQQDLRPFAVTAYRGEIYVGVTYTAETEASGFGDQTARDELVAAVYRLNPATMTFTAAPVFTARLNYIRSQSAIGFTQAGLPTTWEPWVTTYDSTASGVTRGVAPQAMFSGIAFDATGNMTLGLRDRGSDQIGYFSLSDPDNPSERIEGFTAGDMLQAAINVPNNLTAGWTLESNARVGTPATGTGPQGNNAGPGGGEFYHEEFYSTSHGETSMGAVLQLPGRPDVVSTQMDPGTEIRSGGLQWASNTTGEETKVYETYRTTNGNMPGTTFGKANGLGGLAAIVDRPPVEIGNRVWRDTNGNGTQDANEAGIDGVTVQLYTAAGVLVPGATAVTANGGQYYFSNAAGTNGGGAIYGLAGLLPNAAYTIRMDNAANYTGAGPLAGLRTTRQDADATANGDSRDSDVVLPTPGNPIGAGNFPQIAVTTGGPGANNHTHDAGFVTPVSLGNQVFTDVNNNGTRDPGDAGLDGVAVNLYFDADNNGTIDGTETTVFATTATATAGGTAGLYLFTNLAPGNYVVELAASNFTGAGVLVGYASSTGTNGSLAGPSEIPGGLPDPDNNTDNVDDGDTVGTLGAGGTIVSGLISLTPGVEPTGELPNNDAATPDLNSNLTLDFGVFQPLSLGSLVWNDLNNDGDRDAGEPGLVGRTVELRNAANTATIATTTTDANGNYLFSYLTPGDYVVRVALPTGFASSSGTNASATGAFETAPDPDNDADNVDDGSTAGGFATSLAVTLSVGGEPTTGETPSPLITDPARNANSNLTVDLGMYQPLSLGNQVFFDFDNNGTRNGSDVGYNGVAVQLLFDANNDGSFAGAELTPIAGTTTTTVGGTDGLYLFTNLLPGNYVVQLAASNFAAGGLLERFASSTGTNGSVNGAVEGALLQDPDNDTDTVDDGSTVGALGGGGVIRSLPVTLTVGGEPAAETPNNDPAGAVPANTNLTLDFGVFETFSLGNRVWRDANNSGTIDAADGPTPGIAGVTVRLYLDADDNGTPDGGVLVSTTTDANGYYRFDALVAGTYIVEVLTAGLISSSPNGGDPDNDTDSDDNGVVLGAGFVRSNPVTLNSDPGEPIDETDLGPTDPGAQNDHSNLSVDFGFTPTYSLGNRVWRDLDNSGTINANDGLNPGINGVTVRLLNAAGTATATDVLGNPVADAVTAGGGYYRFDNLAAGDYTVQVITTGAALAGTVSSTVNGGDPDNNTDSDDNGVVVAAGTVTANPVTIGGTEPTTEADLRTGANADPLEPNGFTNQTVDFGFVPVFSLGNRVWRDLDNSGTINAADGVTPGIDGVTVRLLDAAGTDAALDIFGNDVLPVVTANGGYYRFDNLPAGDYVVRVTTSGAPLAGLVSSTVNGGDPDSDTDSDDNGTIVSTGFVRSLPVTLGGATPEPAGESDLSGGQGSVDNQANMTVDFGFTPTYSLGNRVWRDLDNSGTINAADGVTPGIDGVTVRLLNAAGTAGVTDILGNPVADVTTAGGGYYRFDNLAAGDYTVQVVTTAAVLAGLARSTPNGGDPDNDIDNDNNGTIQGAGFVRSNPVTLGGATPEPSGETDTAGPGDPGAPNAQSNLSVDFGFTQTFSLGNRVWNDTNNSGTIDAADGLTPGIDGVTVRLLNAAGTAAATDVFGNPVADAVTAGGGYYRFDNLAAGDYTVQVITTGAALLGFVSSAVDGGDPDNNTDSDDNGVVVAAGTVTANPVTLGGTEPTTEADLRTGANADPAEPNSSTNLTVDFGFVRLFSLGNRVWLDLDNSGTINAADGLNPGVNNVTVRLYADANNDNVPDGAALSTTTTANGGYYRFDGLVGGNYVVEVDGGAAALANTVRSTPNGGDPDSNTDSDNNGVAATGTQVRSFSVTLGGGAVEPTGEADLSGSGQGTIDNQANMTVDFGFTPIYSLGNRVWRDANNNGLLDAPDGLNPGINGLTVNVYLDANDDGTPDGAAVATTTTANGGYYRFDGLTTNTYIVEVLTAGLPAGVGSSTVNGGDPDNDADSDDNGVVLGAGFVRSNPVTLGQNNSEPGTEADLRTGSNADPAEPNAFTNLTVDFGFTSLYSLGNRVWRDQNNSGTIDAADGLNPGIDGVAVNLYVDANNDGTADGASIATTTTAGGGYYRFDALTANTYIVEVITTAAALANTVRSTVNGGDPDNDADSDNNGVISGAGFVRANPVTLGPGNAEPTTEADLRTGTSADPAEPNALTNLTVDFGFTPIYSLGNRVWLDANNSGTLDAADGATPGINGVPVNLYLDANNDGVADGPAVATTTTTANGGYYRFDGLTTNTYIVELVTTGLPTGYRSSTTTGGDPDNDLDNDNNGVVTGAGFVRANPVTLGGLEPTGETDTAGPGDPGSANNQSNLTVDFGFAPGLVLGNQVFNDRNNDGVRNGTETGVDGVVVQLLFDADGSGTISGAELTPVATASTAGGGLYAFTNLLPGNYAVQLAASNFTGAGALAGFASTTGLGANPFEPAADPDSNADGADDGNTVGTLGAGGTVASGLITLAFGGEPTTETPDNGGVAAAADTNLTLDFGVFLPYSLGNRVWNDANNNGLLDAGDGATPGLAGVVVNLYRDSNNDGTPDGPAVATTTTTANGYYRFDLLGEDTYIVEVTTGVPAALISSPTNGGDPDNDTDNDDNGVVLGAGFVRSNPVTLGGTETTGETDTAGPGDPGAPNTRSNLSVDFAFTDAYYSLGGNIYYDANNDGTIAAVGEPLITQTTTITLTGTDYLGNPVSLTQTTTSGTYNFTNVRPSDAAGYTLTQTVQPAGYLDGRETPGTPFAGTAPAAGETITAVVIPTNAAPDGVANVGINYNFGELLPASLGDFVWLDVNGNGRQDGGLEVGIPGVSVTLTGTTDRGAITPVTIQTGVGGAYAFNDLRPGTYTVTFGNSTATTTYTRTVQNSPVAAPATDSNANPATGATAPVPLVAGQNDPTIDEGLTLLASVGDTVWFDFDNSGTQNGTEPGIGGVTVRLDYAGPDGAFGTADDQLGVASQVTTGAGFYLFPNLQPGTYRTSVDPATLPAGITVQTYDLDGLGTANQADFMLVAGQDRRDVDYGYRGTATLGDTVWYDIDKTGTQNNNEPGISGVTVGLVWAGRDGTFGTADDVTFPTQATGADGKYLFTNLPAGNFRAAVDTATLPTGVTVNTYDLDSGTTTPNSTADTTLTTGQNRTDVDFGYTGTAALGDRVWLDTNGNGAQDAGEPGIVGVTVTLTWAGPNPEDPADDVVLTLTTGADGVYNFVNLPPGDFNVAVSNVPAGLVQTGDPDTTLDAQSDVTLSAGQVNLLQDFGYQGTSSVAGNVYVDLDNDGVFDPTETPIPGTTVTLTGTDILNNPVTLTATTLAGGSYSFTNLVPGTYTLTETQPAKYGDGKDTVGSLAGTTGNDVFSGIVIAAGQNGTVYNFGELPGTISGVVFYDVDKDGTLDPTETPLPGVTVTLLDSTGTVVGTTQTLPDGSYQFTNLPAGTYTVVETQPTGYGNPPAGPFAPDVRPVTLPPGGNVPNQNFGDTLGSIAGSVYADLNDNGVRDPGEPGIGGVTVTLTGGPTPTTTTTATNGSFLFPNLPAGTYQLVETHPTAYVDGREALGTSGGAIVPADTISTIPLGAGVDATLYTFGELGAAVTGQSYNDVDKDGVFNPAIDIPLGGVTITLSGPGGTRTTTTAPDGTYAFTGLPSGVYTLTETQPNGFGNSEVPSNVRTVTVPANGVVANQNFGNTLGSIAGTVYVDYDLSGAYNPGPDTPLAGITVTLRDGTGAVVATQQTDASGNYLFANLPLGNYTVTETQPPLPTSVSSGGFYDGADNLGSLGGTQPVKNTLAATIGMEPVTGIGQAGVQYNFGELPPADPFGFVYNDLNRNGDMDPGEPGIPGVVITLTGTAFAGSQFQTPFATLTTTTDANGRWEFNPIPPGVYTVTETQPAAYTDGLERNGESPSGGPVTVGNDVFSGLALSPLPIRGPFLFGEFLAAPPPVALPPMDFFPAVVTSTDMSKRQFLSSIDTSGTGTAAPAGSTAPAFASFGASANRPPVYAAVAEDAGMGWVRVFDFGTGAERFRFQPYGNFTGGVRVTTADVTGDGIPDVITAPGVGGGPVVKVFDGSTGGLVRSITAFEMSFRGGLQIAAADLNGDFVADLIVTPDQGGGPIVRAFDGKTGSVLANFLALDETFRGGLRIATGDINKDGTADLLVTAGVGGGPRVAGYSGKLLTTTQGKLFGDFFAFAPELRNGFWVSAADTDGDGFADLTIGAGTGGAPRVGVYSGKELSGGGGTTPVSTFFAGDTDSRSGVRVKALDLDNDGKAEVLASSEAGVLPTVYIYNPLTGARRDAFYGFPTNELGGVYVG